MNGLANRMLRAARLEADLYEEVERDVDATPQALLVVVLASLASGIGAALSGRGGGFGTLVIGILVALVGWFIWSFLTYWIGTSFFQGKATYGELLRTIGFSDSPGILAILGFLPFLGGLIALVAGIWTLVAMVVAVRQALDFSTGKAVATSIVGWAIMLVIMMVFGVMGMGLGMGRL